MTVELPRDVKLPDNAEAKIRQTSLLGEKFVSLERPPDGAGSGSSANGDIIPLDRTGRNPEVEEVLGALSLLLNGGGVGQLKTISTELNKALGGRETEVRSVLTRSHASWASSTPTRTRSSAPSRASTGSRSQLNKQNGTIKARSTTCPRALASINRQRDDLVKMLQALDRPERGRRPGHQGVQGVDDQQPARTWRPCSTSFAEAGDELPQVASRCSSPTRSWTRRSAATRRWPATCTWVTTPTCRSSSTSTSTDAAGRCPEPADPLRATLPRRCPPS